MKLEYGYSRPGILVRELTLAGSRMLDCQARRIHVDRRTVPHYVNGLLLLCRGPSKLRITGGAWEGDYATDIF